MNEEPNGVEHPPSEVNTADILESGGAGPDIHPEPGSGLAETVEPVSGVDPVALDPSDDVIPVSGWHGSEWHGTFKPDPGEVDPVTAVAEVEETATAPRRYEAGEAESEGAGE